MWAPNGPEILASAFQVQVNLFEKCSFEHLGPVSVVKWPMFQAFVIFGANAKPRAEQGGNTGLNMPEGPGSLLDPFWALFWS